MYSSWACWTQPALLGPYWSHLTDWMAPVGFQSEGNGCDSEVPLAQITPANTASIHQSDAGLPEGRVVDRLIGSLGQTWHIHTITVQRTCRLTTGMKALFSGVNYSIFVEAHFLPHWLHLVVIWCSVFIKKSCTLSQWQSTVFIRNTLMYNMN